MSAVPHITLRDIANKRRNRRHLGQTTSKPWNRVRAELNAALGESWEEWEIPREAGRGPGRPPPAELHREWWEQRVARQREIDASIAAQTPTLSIYMTGPTKTGARCAWPGRSRWKACRPSPGDGGGRRRRPTDGGISEAGDGYRYDGAAPERDFAALMLDNLRTSGVQQSSREDKIDFNSLSGWPGKYVCADGRFTEGDDDADGDGAVERRAAIFIGPEFGTVQRVDLVAAAREAAEAGFDLLIACAFSYDAHATELTRIGALPVLKARMNADLHMADTLRNDSRGNLFVIFGEPDVELQDADPDASGGAMVRVKIRGVDIFNPATGQVRSDDTDGIACWFVDTDYNEESFFVRQAYFLGASSDPYRALKTTLRAEIDADAWATLNSDVSRPFPKPASGRIAVKVINHLGDEAMKVMTVR